MGCGAAGRGCRGGAAEEQVGGRRGIGGEGRATVGVEGTAGEAGWEEGGRGGEARRVVAQRASVLPTVNGNTSPS